MNDLAGKAVQRLRGEHRVSGAEAQFTRSVRAHARQALDVGDALWRD
jgi:hypothetical protein